MPGGANELLLPLISTTLSVGCALADDQCAKFEQAEALALVARWTSGTHATKTFGARRFSAYELMLPGEIAPSIHV